MALTTEVSSRVHNHHHLPVLTANSLCLQGKFHDVIFKVSILRQPTVPASRFVSFQLAVFILISLLQ
jgi:hypothetical protein